MERVLVVEDDKYLNKLVCDNLVIEGFDVVSALDGEEAWKLLEQSKTSQPFHAIVLDMLLPKLMGAEILTRLNEDTDLSKIQKICVSGVYRDPVEIERLCALYQVKSYLIKPFDLAKLSATLRNQEYQGNPDQHLSGDLARTPLERLFFQAYAQAFTGSLDLKWKDSERRIYFLNGHPVSASSTGLSENFGAYLVQSGSIDSDQREELSQRMAKEKRFFGELLVETGLMKKAELYQALRHHTYRILLNAFSTRQGSFRFEVQMELPAHIPHIEFNPFLLMIEAQTSEISAGALEAVFQVFKDDFPQRDPRFFQILPLFTPREKLQKALEDWEREANLQQWLQKLDLEDREKAHRILYLCERLKIVHWKSVPSPLVPAAQSFQFDQQRKKEAASFDPKVDAQIRELYMDTLNRNFYELLGVSEEATTEEIEKSYREVRYLYHPDRFQELPGESKRILQDYLTRLDKAYQCLTDQDRRESYKNTVNRMSEDSAADSKRYIQAQDLFRQAQKHLLAERFSEAKTLFDRASQTWAAGAEYRMYSTYTGFRASKGLKPSERQQILLSMKELCVQNPHLETGWLLLGHAHRHLNQISAAREAYQRALKLDPDLGEALNALSHLAQKPSTFRLKLPNLHIGKWLPKASLLVFAAGAFTLLYMWRAEFQSQEAGVIQPDPSRIREHFRAQRIDIKGEIGFVYLLRDPLADMPDAVLRHKCQQSISVLQAYGASRLYLVEETNGLQAVCTVQHLQRY